MLIISFADPTNTCLEPEARERGRTFSRGGPKVPFWLRPSAEAEGIKTFGFWPKAEAEAEGLKIKVLIDFKSFQQKQKI